MSIMKLKSTRRFVRPALSAATMMLLAACSQSYPGLEYEFPDNEIGNTETYNKTPIMMFVNEQNFFSITATRGMGAFENDGINQGVSQMQKQKATLYVYSFRNGQDQQGPLTSAADLTKTRYAQGKTHDEDNESCLLDGPDYNHGMPVKLNTEPGGMLVPQWTEDSLFYSSRYQDVGYNFFCYHIDDCPTSVQRNNDRIVCTCTVDGTQDVLYGYAPKLDLAYLNENYSNLNLSDEEKAKIVNANGYSTYAAHRDIHPEIDLDHAMARFIFQAFPGDENANNIKIKHVKMLAPKQCQLTVAARTTEETGVKFLDEKDWMTLMSWDADQGKMVDMAEATVIFEPEMKHQPWYERAHVDLGSSLLLAPAEEYKLILEYEQYIFWDNQWQWKPLTSEYTIKAPENEKYNLDTATGTFKFLPGFQYTVKIAVYGLSPIKVTANVTNWKEGGDIFINPDDADNIGLDN